MSWKNKKGKEERRHKETKYDLQYLLNWLLSFAVMDLRVRRQLFYSNVKTILTETDTVLLGSDVLLGVTQLWVLIVLSPGVHNYLLFNR